MPKILVPGIGLGELSSVHRIQESGAETVEAVISFGPFPLTAPSASGCAELENVERFIRDGVAVPIAFEFGTATLRLLKARSFYHSNAETISATFGN